MKAAHQRTLRVVLYILLPIVLLAVSVPAANILSGHRLYFWCVAQFDLFGSEALVVAKPSPNGKHTAWLTRHSWLGRTHTVYLTRWWYPKPRRILVVSEETARIAYGPLTDGLVWSKDGHCLALIDYGWYVTLYDVAAGKASPMPVKLRGDVDMAAWQKYHAEVAKRINVK